MAQNRSIEEFLEGGEDLLPGVSIDCVIFGFRDQKLKVLLLRYQNTSHYTLPGGFVHKAEGLDEAAMRVLEERTGLADIFLEQFYTFGQANRTDSKAHRKNMQAVGIDLPADHWLLQRFVSVGYYALVDFSKANPSPDVFSDSCGWHDLATLPPLMLDHGLILHKALETLRLNLDHKLVGSNLLPETFTMKDLQKLYETILDTKLTRTNFQRKMLSLGILDRLEKKMTGGAHRAPFLYRFKEGG